MKKTGTILKEAREKKGISIYEVSTATKINTRNIMAMEEGAVDRLPPKTFLRGFVASYATFLQIDTGEILKIFFEEMGSTRPEVALREQLGSEQSSSRNDDPTKTDKSAVAALTDNKKIGYFKIYGIIGIVILIVVIGLIKRKMDSYESESIQTPNQINSAEAPTPPPAPSSSPAIVVADAVAASPTASPSPTATPVATPTPTATPAPKSTATPTPKPTATPTPSPTATPTPTPTPKPTPKPTPEPTPTPAAAAIPKSTDGATGATSAAVVKPSPSPTPAGRPQEVMIEALDDVEITVQIDNEPSKKMNLHHDEVQSLKARRKVSMKFSDGGAVNLTVNGKDRGVPGDLGKPKKVDVP